ncbi:agamous-like MADS-box protein AGL86 [Sesamum indicum]|uniref:Agamous-like MADS-box protein AGL86 n=1 Tax=Sesamum indicum TaxID=4182 RepID=A0A6I9SUG4_SESIN|nr:agamous-like MADS-box protein AGL86 [Sesamum indicum]
MARKKIKHEQVYHESKRNIVFRTRLDGFLKKANELSILCGVDIGIIIHKQGENNAIQWPSPQIFRERLHKFLDIPNLERTRKMVVHDRYLEDSVSYETKNVLKLRKKNELRQSEQLVNELFQGKSFDELDLHTLNGLQSYLVGMLDNLHQRDMELNDELQPSSCPAPMPAHGGGMVMKTSSAIPIFLENPRTDPWFVETVSQEQDITGFMNFPLVANRATTRIDGEDAARQVDDVNKPSWQYWSNNVGS